LRRRRGQNAYRLAGRKRCAPIATRNGPPAPAIINLVVLIMMVGSAGAAQNAPVTILRPTLGRPVFVEPGHVFAIAVRLPDSPASPPAVTLRARDGRRLPLPHLTEDTSWTADRPIRVRVPAETPAGTYDLLVQTGTSSAQAPHCVAIGHYGDDLRIVHLGDMTVGDVTAPDFDSRLVDEINLVAPTVIIATGDYLDAPLSQTDRGWRRLVDFLTRFDAPAILVCGDRDDMDHYCRFAAPSPVGVVSIGPHRVIVLSDHRLAPLSRDRDQLRWVEHTLTRTPPTGVTIVAAHADRPNLLRIWDAAGTLKNMIAAGHVGLYLAGGSRDWDGHAYRETIDAASPLVYVRTHAASASTRDGADGVPHYRVIDLRDGRVRLAGTAGPPDSPSLPAGRLRAVFDGANDGSRPVVRFRITNTLPVPFDRLTVTTRVRKTGADRPWCVGATMIETVDLGATWLCRVRLDVPDRGAAGGMVGTGPQPLVPKVAVHIDAPDVLRFETRRTRDGVQYQTLVSPPPTFDVRNASGAPLVVTPLVRLAGTPIAYRPAAGPERFADAFRIRLGPGEAARLQPDLSAARVPAGVQTLQVYFEGLTGVGPFCRPLRVELVPAREHAPLARGR